MHWLVPHPLLEGELAVACHVRRPGMTPKKCERHYAGYLEAVTCRTCVDLRKATLRREALAALKDVYTQLGLYNSPDPNIILEAVQLIGVKTDELREAGWIL